MQNKYSERRSYTRGTNTSGNLYNAGGVDSSHVKKSPDSKKRRSAFMGAASIVLNTGGVVLSVIAKGIKATAKLLIPAGKVIPAGRDSTPLRQDTKHDALPHENEL